MLTNGFALFRGDDAATLARDAAARVKRYAKALLASTGGEFGEIDSVPLGRREVVLAFSLGKSSFPLVHGYLDGDSSFLRGEFARLGKTEEGFTALRDSLGTRGLWVLHRGPNAGSLASDYRMLPGRGTLLPPGALYGGGEPRRSPNMQEPVLPHKTFEDAAATLASLIEDSVRERVRGQKRVAVSFSGGLDSSLLALVASRHTEVVLCSAFAPGSRDEGQTERAAALLGLKLGTALLDAETAPPTAKAEFPPGEATLMDRALWAIFSTTSALAERMGARLILLGQLADELFGGYRKYSVKAHEEGEEAAGRLMRDDVRGCADRGFLRDEAACSAHCEVRFPYADAKIASFAESLPFSYKIKGGERKLVLRAAALELGLPQEIASAPKKAAQFSSGTAKLLER